jgi:hydrogenase maturation factor
MTRSFNQRPYRLRHHLDRLYASMRDAEIDSGLTIETNRLALDSLNFQIMHDATRGGLSL